MTFTLYSAGLLSKWGFADGDLFDDFVEDYGTDSCPDPHEILITIVQAYLIPRLKQSVDELSIMETCHNPIRARIVDGRQVDWLNDNPDIVLSPESVEITDHDVRSLFPGGFRT